MHQKNIFFVSLQAICGDISRACVSENTSMRVKSHPHVVQ